MKTIIDTCIWWLSLRRRDTAQLSQAERQLIGELREAIQNRRAAIVGPVRQEVLSGIRDDAQFVKTKEILAPFKDEEIVAGDYVDAAQLFNVCRNHGVQCGPVDMLLCAIAIRLNFNIMTNDQGLLRCMQALRAEGLKL
jgi:hypothetical protein